MKEIQVKKGMQTEMETGCVWRFEMRWTYGVVFQSMGFG